MPISIHENPAPVQVRLIATLNDTCALPPPIKVAGRGGHPSLGDRAYPIVRGPKASGGEGRVFAGTRGVVGGRMGTTGVKPPAPLSSLPL